MINYKLFVIFKAVSQALRADRGVLLYYSLAAAANFVTLRMLGYELGYLLPCCRVALIHCLRKLDRSAPSNLEDCFGDGVG